MSMVHFKKMSLSSVFFVLYGLVFGMLATDQSTQQLEEDAYQTLNAVSFEVSVNNSSKIFAIVNIRKEFCRVSISVYFQLSMSQPLISTYLYRIHYIVENL